MKKHQAEHTVLAVADLRGDLVKPRQLQHDLGSRVQIPRLTKLDAGAAGREIIDEALETLFANPQHRTNLDDLVTNFNLNR